MTHTPVLLPEVLKLLAIQPGECVVDLTAGRGGHACELARAASGASASGGTTAAGRIVLFDLDEGNLQFAAQRVQDALGPAAQSRVVAIHASFADVGTHLSRLGLRANAVLADLGFASTQMDDAARGFSFLRDGPLDMRLDASSGETAADLLARLSERELADAIYQLGEDPFSRRIAAAIKSQQRVQPILTTHELAKTVQAAYGARARDSRMHPATRTFMALRILVNDELGALRALMGSISAATRAAGPGAHSGAAPNAGPGASPSAGPRADAWLAPGARVAVISFHSLEDRLVKHTFADLASAGMAERLTRKPVEAMEREIADNPRSRSAKMRAIALPALKMTEKSRPI